MATVHRPVHDSAKPVATAVGRVARASRDGRASSEARPHAAGLTRNKRPRGRAPAGYGWDEQTGGWLDENGKPFERVDQIRAGNGSELEIARLRSWSAALKSGGLPGCSNKKSSDRHHGKPFSKNVKLILFISGSSRRRRRPRRLRAAASLC